MRSIEKIPNVRRINGPKKSFKIGSKNVCMAVSITAVIISDTKFPENENPCIKVLAARIAIIFATRCMMIFPINFIFFLFIYISSERRLSPVISRGIFIPRNSRIVGEISEIRPKGGR